MSVRSSWLSDTAFPPYGGASTGENVRNHLAQPMARIDRTSSHNLGSNQLMMFATMHEGGGPKHRKSTPTPAPIFTSRAASLAGTGTYTARASLWLPHGEQRGELR
jgi:hypothetical protein